MKLLRRADDRFGCTVPEELSYLLADTAYGAGRNCDRLNETHLAVRQLTSAVEGFEESGLADDNTLFGVYCLSAKVRLDYGQLEMAAYYLGSTAPYLDANSNQAAERYAMVMKLLLKYKEALKEKKQTTTTKKEDKTLAVRTKVQ